MGFAKEMDFQRVDQALYRRFAHKREYIQESHLNLPNTAGSFL